MSSFYGHSYLFLTVISWGRHNSVSQMKFQPLKDLGQERSVSIGQELKFAPLFYSHDARSVCLLALTGAAPQTSSMMGESGQFRFRWIRHMEFVVCCLVAFLGCCLCNPPVFSCRVVSRRFSVPFSVQPSDSQWICLLFLHFHYYVCCCCEHSPI